MGEVQLLRSPLSAKWINCGIDVSGIALQDCEESGYKRLRQSNVYLCANVCERVRVWVEWEEEQEKERDGERLTESDIDTQGA